MAALLITFFPFDGSKDCLRCRHTECPTTLSKFLPLADRPICHAISMPPLQRVTTVLRNPFAQATVSFIADFLPLLSVPPLHEPLQDSPASKFRVLKFAVNISPPDTCPMTSKAAVTSGSAVTPRQISLLFDRTVRLVDSLLQRRIASRPLPLAFQNFAKAMPSIRQRCDSLTVRFANATINEATTRFQTVTGCRFCQMKWVAKDDSCSKTNTHLLSSHQTHYEPTTSRIICPSTFVRRR